ncbi:MAG: maleylpyruvate isomerase N-terminal domain-containing protein [Saprospiraceae bacterium]|nr:maleylpyruvate isomerase N-terminal domain-containing protein [Saprospiraceae bacterium]
MFSSVNEVKIETLHLFPILDQLLIDLLKSLTIEEWTAQTVAKSWRVKDVAAHLLDGNLRSLSTSRDGYFMEKSETIVTYQDLVDFLNRLNMNWTEATKRLSPQILISLLEISGKEYLEHLHTLEPMAQSLYSVAWAGQESSYNWFHIAREYTERFLHQQQIRDAVGKPGIMTKELFYPFMDTLMFACPHTFRNVPATIGTIVSVNISTEIGGQWNIMKGENAWTLSNEEKGEPFSEITIDPNTAWKLFSKSWKPNQVMDKVEIKGDKNLGVHALNMVAFMA